MGFFSKLVDVLSEPVKPPLPEGKVLGEYKFTQSKNFRGHKKFHVSYFGFKPAEDGLAAFRKTNMDLTDAEILLRHTKRDGYEFVDVVVNGYFIGDVAFWNLNPEQEELLKKKLFKGKVDSAHILIEDQFVVGRNEAGKLVQEEREKINIFLHPTE